MKKNAPKNSTKTLKTSKTSKIIKYVGMAFSLGIASVSIFFLFLMSKPNKSEIFTSGKLGDAVKYMEEGGDVNRKFSVYEKTPLWLAVSVNDSSMVKLLLEKGASPNTLTGDKNDKMSPLHLAVSQGNLAIVKILIEGNASIDFTDSKGKSALIYAAQFDHPEIAKYLIDQGAFMDLKDLSGQTAADFAKESGPKVLVLLKPEARP